MAFESGQLAWPSVIPRHRFASATASRAGRMCPAWLSPMSATVAVARSGSTPKPHTCLSTRWKRTLQCPNGRFACFGVGRTMVRRRGLWQGLRRSRDAAPKQRGSFRATRAATGARPPRRSRGAGTARAFARRRA